MKESVKQRRITNYIDYLQKDRMVYTYEELSNFSVEKLLSIVPQNHCTYKFNEKLGCDVIDCVYLFRITKTIDGYWNIGYYENDRRKLLSEQKTFFEVVYAKDIKDGIISNIITIQEMYSEYLNGIKSGKNVILLDNQWDNLEILGLE